MTAVEIKLKRISKVYHEGESVAGLVILHSKDALSHNGIKLTLEGTVTLTTSAKSVGRLEALYSSVKPINLIAHTLEIAKPGRFLSGKTEIPFEIQLTTKQGKKLLYETYHGVYVNIQYNLRCVLKRTMLSNDITKDCEVILEYNKGTTESALSKPMSFTITPGSLLNVKNKTNVPRFTIRGKIDSSSCCVTKPFTGDIIIEKADIAIRSIEIQLLRVETVGCAEGYSQEATEIQNIEIACGDICHGLAIPIYMVFPRLFSCPTLETTNFKIEFEVNIVVVFNDDQLVMEKFPIRLTRF